MVSIAERQAQTAHQPIGQIGRGGKAARRRRAQDIAVGGHVRHHPRHRRQTQHQRIGRIKGLFLVLLHVLGIGQRQPFHDGEQGHRRPQNPPQFSPKQLGRIGVFLLRHDRTARRPLVTQPHKAELRRRPDHQFLGKAAEMHGANAAGRQKLQREIAVTDRIKAVRRRPVKAQRLRRGMAINRERRPRQRRRPQGALIHPLARILKPAAVAREHLDIGQHVMPPCHRLGGLQMGKARHHPVRPRLGLRQERPHQFGQPGNRRIALVAHPKPEIDGHLIIAAPPGVQPLARLADNLGQAAFHVQVNILQRGGKGKLPPLDL